MNRKELLAALERAAASEKKILDLDADSLSVEDVVALAQSPLLLSIQRLYLWGSRRRKEKALAFVQSPYLSGLLTLNLQFDTVGDAGAMALAQSPHMAELQVIRLSASRITDAGAMALAQSPHLAGLQIFDLRHNSITDAGAMALAQSPHLAGLRHLLLWGNSLTDAGCDGLDLRDDLLLLESPALASAIAAEPANLFLLARLFLEQGRVNALALFASLQSTPPTSLFWGWLESQAEQVEDAFVQQALSFFPTNERLRQRAEDSSFSTPPRCGA